MNGTADDRHPRGRLDRPTGLPPRGSRYGLMSFMGLGILTPMMAGFVAGSRSPRGMDVLTPAMAFGFLAWLVLLIAGFVGLAQRRYWGIALGWSMGLVLALVYPVVLVAGVLGPFGLAPTPGEDAFTGWYALGWLACMLPLHVLLCRMLRLRFWQPWTRPDQWESGDEAAPGWAMTVLDHTRPWLADDIRRAQGLPPPVGGRRGGKGWWRVLPWLLGSLALARVALLILG